MEEEPQYQPVELYNPGPQYDPGPNRFTFFAGVILPTISITVEATTHLCATVFFNPIPTIWHLLLVLFVPLAQLQTWYSIRRRRPEQLALAGFLNALTIGISIFYSIVYIRLIPLALLALLFGLGLLPLTPLLSLIASLIMRRQLKRVAATAPRRSFALKARGLLAGLALTVAVIGMVELPATITTIGLLMASSSSPQTQADGIRFLRRYGNKEALLRKCYDRKGWATDVVGAAFKITNPITPEEAQKIYYRVTGETYDGSIPPEYAGEQAGAGKLTGLSLASSKLDGSVDANGGVGYMEWTLNFRNDSDRQREARAEVQLPPGGVVSRLTLWVNGEEREAAFAGRGRITDAYQKVGIQSRRDPVVITTAGRDRILVQCFPVPPNQGEMKIRFGITLPLVLEDETHAKLLMPHFVFRNFSIPENVKHTVWVQAKTPMWPYSDVFMPSRQQDSFSTAGAIDDDTLSSIRSCIMLYRYGSKEMWTRDPFNPRFAVIQSVTEQTSAHLRRIVLVVDTSEKMQGYIPDIQAAMRSLPFDFDVKLILADSDGLPDNIPLTGFSGQDAEMLLVFQRATFAGGADNVPALLKGWDVAAQTPGNNAIVWIHSPQRLMLTPLDELRRRWENRPFGPTLYSVQATAGADEIEKRLDGINEVKSVTRTGLLQTDLTNLFAQLTGRVKTLQFVRSSRKLDKGLQGIETSDHLARLWANDEVARILAPQDGTLTDEATALSVQYQLVTPVSGAVVLDNAERYRASDLQPVDAVSVPAISRSGTMALLILAGAFVIWLWYMKYRQGRGTCTV